MAETDGRDQLSKPVRPHSPGAMPEGVAVYALDGSLQGAEPEFVQLAGLTQGDAALHHLGALVDWLRPRRCGGDPLELSPPGAEHRLLAEVEIAGRSPVELRIRPLRLGGEACGHLVGLRDRAARRRLRQQTQQAQKMEAIGRLVGGISHDFNNLLTVIRGYGDLAREQLAVLSADLPAVQRRPTVALGGSLDEIIRASASAAELTRQLLAYSRQQVLSPRLLDLEAEVREARKMLDRLLGDGFALELDLGHGRATVHADRGQIHQILMNLVLNARDAMPDGGRILLRTEPLTVDARFADRFDYPVELGEKVLLRVVDEGDGIDPEVLPHIFEPFFTTKELGRGTGLGLSTVYGIVKQSGGYLWVDSRPGVGTEFRVCLPRARGAAAPPPRPEASPARPDSAGQRLLVVDDEARVRLVISELLQRDGYRVHAAASLREALAAQAAGERFDLAVVDLAILDRDDATTGEGLAGGDLASRLQASQPGLPVLFISGYDPDAYERRGGVVPEGASFLPKPLDAVRLRRRVASLLADGRSPVTPPNDAPDGS